MYTGRAGLKFQRAGPGKNMRSYQRAGPGVEDNGPGRAGSLRPVQVSSGLHGVSRQRCHTRIDQDSAGRALQVANRPACLVLSFTCGDGLNLPIHLFYILLAGFPGVARANTTAQPPPRSTPTIFNPSNF